MVDPLTFDELFAESNLSRAERQALLAYLSTLRAVSLFDLLRERKAAGPVSVPSKAPNRARGGLVRAAKLTPARRSEIARKAALTRWRQSSTK